MEIDSIYGSKLSSIMSDLSLRDPVQVVFLYWVEAISTVVVEIATQKRLKIPVFARNHSCLIYDAIARKRRFEKLAPNQFGAFECFI
jgi:hypothetical protein